MGDQDAMVLGSKVLKRFSGDEGFPVEWEGMERDYHWFYDDLHCPNPMSPMYETLTPWWGETCEYMYRRFWAPFGSEWLGKVVNRYIYTAIAPRDPQEIEAAGSYYGKVMPVYARKFLGWWDERLLPEVQRNYEYLDSFDYENAPLAELMILLEDYLDIFNRHFRLHWILNLAAFQATIEFRVAYHQAFGTIDEEEIGRILVSLDDKNWESIRGVLELRDYVKSNSELKRLFDDDDPAFIYSRIKSSEAAKDFCAKLDDYLKVFGYKSIYPHEYLFETWIENPVPVIELIKAYLEMDYDVEAEVKKTTASMQETIEAMLGRVKDEEQGILLRQALDVALPMQPLTPNHHFWLDQGCHARGRLVLLAIGEKLTKECLLGQADDVIYLKYNELRTLFATPEAINGKDLAASRRKENEEVEKLTPPDWLGTVTQWSNYEEPYKGLWGFPEKAEREAVQKGAKEFRGVPGSGGVVEGVAVIVRSPNEFDKVKPGSILVCKMTSPAWITVFPKICGLVTDSGGMLAHPAIIAREFGIPAVVGTGVATQMIRNGQTIRVNGSKGLVEILD